MIEEKLPDADVLVPYYPSWLFSNADPVEITENLLFIIDEAVKDRKLENEGDGYEEIILIGFSMGALLVRKLYVFARGKTEDSKTELEIDAMEWADKVSRIILLAGMNRGWSVHPKPQDMGWFRCLGIRFLTKLGWLLGFGRLIRSVRRGTPFVTNLRLQWLSAINSEEHAPPATIQLLGDIDDIVNASDSIDLQSGSDFIYLKLLNTGHLNLLDLSGEDGERRKEMFIKALVTPIDDLRSHYRSKIEKDETVEKVVFLMHGIRDHGHWSADLRERIEKMARQRQKKVKVVTSGYGYFPMLRFLFFAERQKNVRWFMDQYTEAKAKYPNAKFDFIGHSNGTYLLASALQNYEACTFNNIVFAGSVVRTSFPWDHLIHQKRASAVCNYVASKDWIVGVFPGFYELLNVSDLGSAGHNGFLNSTGKEHAVTFISGGHGAAITEANYDAMARFVFDGTGVEIPEELHSEDQSSLVVWLSRLNWVVWVILIAGFIAGGVVIGINAPWWWLAGYVALLLLLLFTL